MSREGVEQLIDRWINEPAFRTEMRADPMGAVRRTGIDLTDDEIAALRKVDWTLSDTELHARYSKTPLGGC